MDDLVQIRPRQVWSMSALSGGRTLYRVIEITGDVVHVLIDRGPGKRSRSRTISAAALRRGTRGARLELDEHGAPVDVQPIVDAVGALRREGATVREIGQRLQRSSGAVQRALTKARASGRCPDVPNRSRGR